MRNKLNNFVKLYFYDSFKYIATINDDDNDDEVLSYWMGIQHIIWLFHIDWIFNEAVQH